MSNLATALLALHAPTADGRQCAYCASLCHSRSGLGCDSPDAPYPCPTVLLIVPADLPADAHAGHAGTTDLGGQSTAELIEAAPLAAGVLRQSGIALGPRVGAPG